MKCILRVRDESGRVIDIPAIVGPAGKEGNPGVYVLKDGETIADAPSWAAVVVDPNEEPPSLELTATFADGSTKKYALYGEVVAE